MRIGRLLHVAGERARRMLGTELRVLGVPNDIVSDPVRWNGTLSEGVDATSGWSGNALSSKQAARIRQLLLINRLDPREHVLLGMLAERAEKIDPQR